MEFSVLRPLARSQVAARGVAAPAAAASVARSENARRAQQVSSAASEASRIRREADRPKDVPQPQLNIEEAARTNTASKESSYYWHCTTMARISTYCPTIMRPCLP